MTAKVPVVLCHEMLGIIDELPKEYNGEFRIGQRVVVNPVTSCEKCTACKNGLGNACAGLKINGIHCNGGFAEYVAVPVSNLVKVNPDTDDEVAALSEPFAVGYHVNQKAGTNANTSVFVAGAGTIGIVVALVARQLGARDIVISEINETRASFAKEFGFDVVNPIKQDINTIKKDGFDIVIDASGAKASILTLPNICRIGGKILSLGLSGAPVEFILGKISFKEQTVVGSRLYSKEDFAKGVEAMEEISKIYDLKKIVTDKFELYDIVAAFEKMKSGENISKILISCNR